MAPSQNGTNGNMDLVDDGQVLAFDHIRFWVGNAKQAADWYCVNFGFKPFAYRGLETGNRHIVSYAVKQNKIILVLESALLPNNHAMGDHLVKHGDGIRDVAFEVDNIDWIVEHAKRENAKILEDIHEESDEHGTVKMASIQAFGDTIHTLIERKGRYTGVFLPGYKAVAKRPTNGLDLLANPGLNFIDHYVGNQPALQMEPVIEWYENVLQFHRFWSVDDYAVHTEFSGLRSVIVANKQENVKLTVAEPVKGGKGVSQTQEFVDFYGGAGVQHLGLDTSDIIHAVEALRERGVEFLSIPDTYYEMLRKRLKEAKMELTEDLVRLQKLKILVDFDENGYMLQIFAKPCTDRPTFFLEVLQRHNYEGFGANNFKSLFEAIEFEQNKRGNLFYDDVEVGGKRI